MDCEKLESLFVSDLSKAIDESKKIICSISKFDSFEDFSSYHLKNAHFYYCPKPFGAEFIPQISIYCIDCSTKDDDLNLICLPCFLNGNHEGHNYFIFPGFMGNCKCGDKFHLKSSGFCSQHQGFEDDDNIDNYLDENLRSVLINLIFTASFKAIHRLQGINSEKSAKLGDFIISFFNLGDGFRRLFVRAITQNDLLNTLIDNVKDSPGSVIMTIFSYLMQDQLFMKNFSKSVISHISNKVIKNTSEYMVRESRAVSSNCKIWYQFIYACFSNDFCRYNIESNGWDWVTFSIELLKQYKRLLILFKSDKYTTYPLVFNIIKFIHFASSIQPNDETQDFFDKIFTQVFNTGVNDANDTIIIDTYEKYSISTDIDSYLDFISMFNYLMNSFKSKENLKFDKLIEELEKSLDITPLFIANKNNENDKLISRFIINKDEQTKRSLFSFFTSTIKKYFGSYPSKYYKSFSKGASFFISHPLYDSFLMLFKVDDLCRIKLARFLCQEKYQSLRIKLGIVTLKKLLSSICFKMGLVPTRNYTILILFDKIYEDKKEIINNMIPISALQLLIGLQCNHNNDDDNTEFSLKEFFAFELAREIGIFDDANSKGNDLLIFTFLYVSLMIVIDRNLFNYEYINILEEQIIFALKKGVHSIDELNGICNTNLDNPKEYFTSLNDILMKVARKSTNEDEGNNSNNDDDANITLKFLSSMKSSDNDDDDDDDEIIEGEEESYTDYYDGDADDDDTESEKIKNKPASSNNNNGSSNNKKENQNSYIKPVNFYLKDEIECNAISAVNPINDQKSYLNIEISKNQNKLLKIQDFESEDTYFFHSNNDELKIRLKQFLQTPTVLAIVYDTLRTSSEKDQQKTELNDHLAMNILILISKFIKEDQNGKNHSKRLNDQITIQYNSLSDLITELKHVVFNYQSSEEKSFIENALLNPTNFVLFLKLKIEPKNHQPKSIIDLLLKKGQIGQESLRQISSNIHIDDIDFLNQKENEINTNENDLKVIQKRRASNLKEEILNQFSNIRNHYHFSDSISDSLTLSNSGLFSTNKDVCSLCSETKKKEILCYPLYIYRTKFPFIVDKPPLVNSEEVEDIAVYDNENDFNDDCLLQDENCNSKHLSKIKEIISNIQEHQKVEKIDLNCGNEKLKRVTIGANFIIQYGICPHPVHRSCIKEDNFICPIDRSMKNGFLPFLDDIPINLIFKDMKAFELNSKCSNNGSLQSNIIESISSFIDEFHCFLKSNSLNIFIELIKSISGLIDTYEIRVRNLPDSLDSIKTKILARNLFLTVWYEYRIQKKPNLKVIPNLDSRLTDFQKFIKMLIEFDDIENLEISSEVKKMIELIVNSIEISEKEKSVKRKEKEICLFLRRCCLAEYFLLNIDVKIEKNELIDWDEILSTKNLSQRYNVKFTTVDITKNEEFVFKPFVFMKFPKDYLRLSEMPYKLPISEVSKTSMFSILDYNYLIKYYDDFKEDDDEVVSDDDDDEVKRYRRTVLFCDDAVLHCFMNIIGKLNYPSILMFTGGYSSQIYIVDQFQGAALETPYVDNSGCPDINHVRMQPLILNDDRYEKLIEQILSGDFSYKLTLFEQKKNLIDQDIESSDLF